MNVLREDFYTDRSIDINKLKTVWDTLESKCNYKEIMWLFRNFAYEAVRYSSKDDCGPIYQEGYSNLTMEQANRFQQQISTVVDLFTQSVVDRREFNEDYLKKYEFAGPYLLTIQSLKERIDQLEQQIFDYENGGEI